MELAVDVDLQLQVNTKYLPNKKKVKVLEYSLLLLLLS